MREFLLGFDTDTGLSGPDDEHVEPAPARDPELVRGGTARLTRLRVVDAFGRSLELDDAAIAAITVSDQLDAAGPGSLLLAPRITAPSRLLFRFVHPDDDAIEARVDQEDPAREVSPVAGWLLPDHVDGALELFDAAGEPVGQLLHEGLGGAVVFEGAPGVPGPAGVAPPSGERAGDRHVAGFAVALARRDAEDRELPTDERPGESPLSALLRAVDTTLWTVDPFGLTGLEHLSLLTGRPIALVRAALELEVRSDVAELPLDAEAAAARQARFDALAGTAFPVRLGALTRADDGLLGYFLDDDYRTFHPVHPAVLEAARPAGPRQGFLGSRAEAEAFADELGEAAEPITHPYLGGASELALRPGQRRRLTLLVVPGGAIHLTSGISPRKEIALLRSWISEPLARIAPSFRVGPVLVDPETIRMPRVSTLRPGAGVHAPDRAGDVARRPDRGGQPAGAAAGGAGGGAGGLPPGEDRRRRGGGRVLMAQPYDDPGGRAEWFHRPRGGRRGLPGQAFLRAAQQRRAAPEPPPSDAPLGPPAPAGSLNWTPLGPFAVSGGQASGHPVVSGRIEAIAAGPGGTRVYVGAADGGAWFSPDGGLTWEALDDFLTTPAAPVPARQANSLSVGALAVSFGADRAADQVYVGTGEHRAGFRGLFGIGVRVSTSGGVDGSWTLEATNLAGLGCTKMAIDPDNPALVLVATTGGLFQRPAAGRANWTQVTAPGVFTNAAGVVSDVLIAGTGASKTYYAAFEGDRVYSSPDLAAWTAVPGGPAAADGRVVLAASEVTPAVVYAFCQSRRLLRLTAGSFVAVTGVPTNIFGTRGIGHYCIILAVDPGAADTIYIGGALVWDQAPGDPVADWTLALFRGTVATPPAAPPAFPFAAASNGPGTRNVFRENGDATYVGRGIHPDAQSIAFSRRADNTGLDGAQVWIGCDGGLFRSTASGALGTFTACNTGLATIQLTYMASHPTLESVALAGCQDNGTVRWRGGPVWHEPAVDDGGGVAIDPNNPYRMLRQTFQTFMRRTTTGGATAASWADAAVPAGHRQHGRPDHGRGRRADQLGLLLPDRHDPGRAWRRPWSPRAPTGCGCRPTGGRPG